MKTKLFLTLFLSIFIFSCSKNEENNISENKDSNKTALFQEIFFGNNPNTKLSHIQDLVSMKNDLTSEQLLEVHRIENLITTNIEKIDNQFFDNFNSDIRSGNHLTVKKALDYGGLMLEKALLNSPEIAEEVMLGKELAEKIDINDFKKPDGSLDATGLNDFVNKNYSEYKFCGPTFCVAAVYLAVAVSVAVAVNYAGAVNVYVWFNAFKWTNGPSKTKGSITGSLLQEEILINEIVHQYGVIN